MTKDQLASLIQKKANLESRTASEDVVDAFVAVLREELSTGKTVTIRNFGTFMVVDRAARKGRNPKTGEVIDIPPTRAVRFVPGSMLRSAATGNGEGPGKGKLTKAQLTKQMEERLQEFKSTIDGYLSKSGKLSGDAKKIYQENLKPKYEEARLKFKLLRSSSGDAWDEMRIGFERAYSELRDAFARAKKRI
jgi:DNA-binding protein HU-beta